jgi:hypothetical protein
LAFGKKDLSMRSDLTSAARAAVLAAAAWAVLSASASAQGQGHRPLDAAEKARVNAAIDRGVEYLKLTQGPLGTWAAADAKSWQVGYAALPGLTLLECGVSPKDPAVQRVALAVRRAAPAVDQTYEVSLCILFLDRLGDPADEKLIQMLAMRLVAGQAPSGGWGYKVPALRTQEATALLHALRQSEPPTAAGLLVADPLRSVPQQGTGNPGGSGSTGSQGTTGPISGSTGSTGSQGSTGSTGSTGGTVGPGVGGAEDDPPAGPTPGGLARSPRGGLCIKMLEGPGPERGERTGAKDKPFVPPAAFRGLVVFNDPNRIPMLDPKEKPTELILSTTDNSNTQFATLALWVAQRHDVPLKRTLAMVDRRFRTSQNADGSWGYHYVPGGGSPERPPMTAVGLIGLAVGHGLVADGGPPVQDRRVLNGFVALSKNVGRPSGRWDNLPQPNLYHLWSVERVGVLYNIDVIDGKDWYRWGAEALLANQRADGSWDKGGYWSATPTIDTCLALLFLKRANLVSDLSDRLPIDPGQLSTAIKDQSNIDKAVPPRESLPPKQPEPTDPTLNEKLPGTAGGTGDKGGTKNGGAAKEKTAPPEEKSEPAAKRPLWPFLLIGAAMLLLFAGAAFLAVRLTGGGDADDDDEEEPGRPTRGKKGRKGRR